MTTRRWWRHRLDELKDSWSWSFGLSTLLHVGLIVLIGSWWLAAHPDAGVASLDTRWTDTTEQTTLDDSVEMTWSHPKIPEESGGSQSASEAVFAAAAAVRPFEPTANVGSIPVNFFGDTLSNDELGAELSDLKGWQDALARIGRGGGTGGGIGSGQGTGGRFFGMKAKGQSVVYVVDCSSSMNYPHRTSTTRFKRLQLELLNSVAGMKSEQSFYIIFFNDQPIPMPTRRLQPARPELQRKYLEWMARMRAGGYTDPLASLKMAIQLRPDVIYFLTDGNFTYRTAVQLSRISQPRSMIHTITFGERDAEPLMRAIARNNRGTYRFIP